MCDMCGWDVVLDQIEDMQGEADNVYNFAEKTLNGIADWIKENEHVTIPQKEAINNIQDSR